MERSFSRLVSSPIVTFRVGDGKEEIMVHSGPMAALSPAMRSTMKEASRKVEWPCVKKETFMRLCDFAYLQDYTTPAVDQGPHSEPAENMAPKNHEFWAEWDTLTPLQRKRKEREALQRGITPLIENSSSESEDGFAPMEKAYPSVHGLPFQSDKSLQEAFSALKYTPTRQAQQVIKTTNTWPNTPNQDFKPVFFGHAELYIVADEYLIEPLRQLALYKLHQTLENFTIYGTNVL